jgi:hypothetical protein
MPEFIPRPAQAAILRYTHGKMGIAASPAAQNAYPFLLAADLIASDASRRSGSAERDAG